VPFEDIVTTPFALMVPTPSSSKMSPSVDREDASSLLKSKRSMAFSLPKSRPSSFHLA